MAFKRNNSSSSNSSSSRSNGRGGSSSGGSKSDEARVPRKRTRYLDPNVVVDMNDPEYLRRFVTEYGKIVPARLTGVTAQQQRDIKQGVRRARNMGLLA
jgi:small subunit ribosomal protein S18